MRGIKKRSFVDGTVFFTSRITTDDGLMGTCLLELPDPQLTTGSSTSCFLAFSKTPFCFFVFFFVFFYGLSLYPMLPSLFLKLSTKEAPNSKITRVGKFCK
jgi:hypothetical protein